MAARPDQLIATLSSNDHYLLQQREATLTIADTKARLTDVAQQTYETTEERAALRCALADASALCDSLAMEIGEAHRGRSGKGAITKLGRQLQDIAKKCADEIWSMRELVVVNRQTMPEVRAAAPELPATAPGTLLARLDAATGPSPELDWLVAEYLDEIPPHTVRTVGFDYDWYRHPGEFTLSMATDSEGRSFAQWSPDPRTRDIGYALATVPDGWTVARIGQNDDKTWHCELREGFATSYTRVVFGPSHHKAATPVLAVLSAALRARGLE